MAKNLGVNRRNSIRILIVDDDEKMARLLELHVNAVAVASCQICHSASDALMRLKETSFDLVITDKNMPGMSGLALARRINQQYPDVILVLLSGYPDLEDLTNAINDCGISYFISKPW